MRETKGKSGAKKWEDLKDHQLLFATGTVANRVGKDRIEIQDECGRLLALGHVHGTGEPFHPWMPWFFLGEFGHFPKTGLVRGVALPDRAGRTPLAIIKDRKGPALDWPA